MKWRLMTALMSVTLLVLLVQDVPLGFYLQQVEHDRVITALERDSFVLAGRSVDALATETPTDDANLTSISRAYRDAGGARVIITNKNGTVVATSDADQGSSGDNYSSRQEIQDALAGRISTGHRFSATLNQELLYVAVPVLSGESVEGVVRLTYPDQAVTDAVSGQLWILSLVILVAIVFAGLVGYVVSITVTRRIRRLQEATEALAEGDLAIRADESAGAPELRALAQSFNDMAARLESLIMQQRTFAADASHQLRTPLTALRLRLERAHDLLETDPAGAADRLAAAEAEADRLGNLIEGLLLLSRTEASTAPLLEVDLAPITNERVDHWRALAAEHGVTLQYRGPVTARIWAVASAAEQIIDNYLDNALVVAPRNSRIELRITESAELTTIHVQDEGPGLSPRDCERAFDRFWRGKSDKTGSGLGLAIVAQLALASRGHVALTPRPEGGLDASASFARVR